VIGPEPGPQEDLMIPRARRIPSHWIGVLALIALVCLGSASPVGAQTAAPFKGATITISIGYPAGGGFDLYARLLARYYGKHVPGNPSIVSQNVVGAGSLKLANTLYAISPRDGTAIGMVAQTLPVDQLLGSPGINFDFAKFSVIGRMAPSGTVLVSSNKQPVRSIEDARKEQLVIGATGPSSEAFIVPALLNNLAGTKFKITSGYAGTQEMVIAMERGEADGATIIVSSLVTQFSRLLQNNEVSILVQNALKRDPAFPDIPTTMDAALTAEGREIMKLFAIGNDIGRSFILPPGVPQDRVAILRTAFMETMADRELQAAAKTGGIDLDPMRGEDIQAMITSISEMSPDLLKKAAEAKQWSK
jgi:tripartite-type tricarboxylate transporter receptor subunit TctC